MPRYQWEVRSTGRPYSLAERIEPDDYRLVVSTHTTLGAARQAREACVADMRRRCGPSGWDNHYYVFPLCPTPMRAEIDCAQCGRHISTEQFTWQPLTFAPVFGVRICEDCVRQENEEGARAQAEEDARWARAVGGSRISE